MTKWDVFFGVGILLTLGIVLDAMNIYEHWKETLVSLGYVLLGVWGLCGVVYFLCRFDDEDSVL